MAYSCNPCRDPCCSCKLIGRALPCTQWEGLLHCAVAHLMPHLEMGLLEDDLVSCDDLVPRDKRDGIQMEWARG